MQGTGHAVAGQAVAGHVGVGAGHALVTGASSGIGAAIAREYARRGVPLVLSARRLERLESLAVELRERVAVECIAADLSDPVAPARLQAELAGRGIAVSRLVNNAGYGLPGRFLSSDWDAHRDFLQVMVGAVVELTHRLLPAMETAGHTLYGASKAFVIRFSESLARESLARGVHVTALCPGMTWTEFHDVNGMRERVSRLPRWLWMDAASVARLGVEAVERGDARCVPGAANRTLAGLAKYLPEGLARALLESRSRDFRDAD
jgi:short-subunit dehydrogenase